MVTWEDCHTKIQNQLRQELPFVVYRKPQTHTVMLLFQKDDKLYRVQHYSESGFVFAKFYDQQYPVYIPSEHGLMCRYETPELTISISEIVQRDTASKIAYLNLVSEGVSAVKAGKFSKVVLSRNEEIKVSMPDIAYIFTTLLTQYPEAFCYAWYHPKVGMWAGATPELLLRVKGDRLATMALAGTQPFKGNLDVFWNIKEREEQDIVSRFIISRLQPVVKALQMSKAYTVNAGKLVHLRTDITGIIPNVRRMLPELISILHPTPAVCGYPLETARQFILEQEYYDRSFYTGFLGELNFSMTDNRSSPVQASLYVNLRCMQLIKTKAVVYIGSGITKDSIPENEWEETVNKAQTIRNALLNNFSY